MAICPDGFICFNRETVLFIFVSLMLISLYGINSNKYAIKQKSETTNTQLNKLHELETKIKLIEKDKETKIIENKSSHIAHPNIHVVDTDYQRITNPLVPPEMRNPLDPGIAVNGVPINIPTRGTVPNFQQIGSVSNMSGAGRILPLYGKPTYPGSSKWIYYTINNDFPSVKLPIQCNGKDCTGEYGCNELYESDNVIVPPYNEDFKISLYQFDKPRYIPYV